MARARGERSNLAGIFEGTEKTSPATGYFLLPHMSNGLERREDLIADDLVGRRDPGDADLDNPVVQGPVGIPIDVEAVGFWLKALMGAPTTTEDTGVYTHVFESGAWSLPSMSLERQFPDVPSYEMFSGVRANSLQIDVQRGGRLNGTVNLIGQGAATPTGTATDGSETEFTLSRFMQKEAHIEFGGTDVANLVSASLTFSNNLDAVETVTADGFIGGLDPMRTEFAGSVRMRFDSETHFATAKAGTPIAVSLIVSKTASASLTLSLPRCFLNAPGRPVDGPGGIEAEFQLLAARASDNSAMLTATLINEVDAY